MGEGGLWQASLRWQLHPSIAKTAVAPPLWLHRPEGATADGASRQWLLHVSPQGSRPNPNPNPPPLPESGWKVGGSRHMARCHPPPPPPGHRLPEKSPNFFEITCERTFAVQCAVQVSPSLHFQCSGSSELFLGKITAGRIPRGRTAGTHRWWHTPLVQCADYLKHPWRHRQDWKNTQGATVCASGAEQRVNPDCRASCYGDGGSKPPALDGHSIQ